MSADTLAERIRASARILAIELTGDRQRGRHRISHYAKKIGDFALSELSAAEQAERERCCKDVCDYCRHDGPPADCRNEDHATPAGDDGYPPFMHRYEDGTEHECAAASIRNRE